METPSPGQTISPQNSSDESQPPVAQNSEQPPISPYAQPETLSGLDSQPIDDAISWTASEYIAHHKSSGWYATLAFVGLVLAGVTFFLTSGDIVSMVVVVLVVFVFGFYGARKPREQQYAISPDGITIGPKTYQFSQFKSFAIIDEDAFASITFMPMQRFMPVISVYYDPQDEEVIVDALSVYLPMESRTHDPVERLMRKIRF